MSSYCDSWYQDIAATMAHYNQCYLQEYICLPGVHVQLLWQLISRYSSYYSSLWLMLYLGVPGGHVQLLWQLISRYSSYYSSLWSMLYLGVPGGHVQQLWPLISRLDHLIGLAELNGAMIDISFWNASAFLVIISNKLHFLYLFTFGIMYRQKKFQLFRSSFAITK